MNFKFEEMIQTRNNSERVHALFTSSEVSSCVTTVSATITQMLTQSRQGTHPPSHVLHLISLALSSLAPLPSLTRWPQIQCIVKISNFTMLPINILSGKVNSTNLLGLDFSHSVQFLQVLFKLLYLSIACPWDHLS